MSKAPVGGEAHGFAHRVRKNGDVEVTHRGRQATVLKGKAAATFVAQVSQATEQGAQQVMARVTGNYRRGNERVASVHPRSVAG